MPHLHPPKKHIYVFSMKDSFMGNKAPICEKRCTVSQDSPQQKISLHFVSILVSEWCPKTNALFAPDFGQTLAFSAQTLSFPNHFGTEGLRNAFQLKEIVGQSGVFKKNCFIFQSKNQIQKWKQEGRKRKKQERETKKEKGKKGKAQQKLKSNKWKRRKMNKKNAFFKGGGGKGFFFSMKVKDRKAKKHKKYKKRRV